MAIADLSLPEALVLCLAGTTPRGAPAVRDLSLGLAGAVLTDLWLAGRVDLTDRRVRLTDPSALGRAPYDDVLARMAGEAKPRRTKWWIWHLARLSAWVPLVEVMRERNAISIAPYRNKLGITSHRVIVRDTGTQRALVDEIEACCAANDGPRRTRSLVSLVWTMSQNVTSGYDRPATTTTQVSRLSRDLWPALAVAGAFADTY